MGGYALSLMLAALATVSAGDTTNYNHYYALSVECRSQEQPRYVVLLEYQNQDDSYVQSWGWFESSGKLRSLLLRARASGQAEVRDILALEVDKLPELSGEPLQLATWFGAEQRDAYQQACTGSEEERRIFSRHLDENRQRHQLEAGRTP